MGKWKEGREDEGELGRKGSRNGRRGSGKKEEKMKGRLMSLKKKEGRMKGKWISGEEEEGQEEGT